MSVCLSQFPGLQKPMCSSSACRVRASRSRFSRRLRSCCRTSCRSFRGAKSTYNFRTAGSGGCQSARRFWAQKGLGVLSFERCFLVLGVLHRQHALAMVDQVQRRGARRIGAIELVDASLFHIVEGFRHRSICEALTSRRSHLSNKLRAWGRG